MPIKNSNRSSRVQVEEADSMPPSTLDVQLNYNGYHGCQSHCRIRVYLRSQNPVVIVATEVPSNEGTSITNMSEHVMYMGLELAKALRPGLSSKDCTFVEHYMGLIGSFESFDAERWSIVTFDANPDGTLRVQPVRFIGGGTQSQFATAKWQHLSDQDFRALVGELPAMTQ